MWPMGILFKAIIPIYIEIFGGDLLSIHPVISCLGKKLVLSQESEVLSII